MLLENTPTLLTPRLILRRFAPEDLPAVFDIYSDREANRFLPWFPAETMADARRFLEERYLAVYERPSGYAYAVCRREDNIPIGYLHVDTDEPTTLDTVSGRLSGGRDTRPRRGRRSSPG